MQNACIFTTYASAYYSYGIALDERKYGGLPLSIEPGDLICDAL